MRSLQGHEDEVASVGSSLASYFSVFHRLLIARLRVVANQCSADTHQPAVAGQTSLANLAKELVDSCSHSLHTYLHAQVGQGLWANGSWKCLDGRSVDIALHMPI